MNRAEVREVLSAYSAIVTEIQEGGMVASDFDFEELVDMTLKEVDHKKFS